MTRRLPLEAFKIGDKDYYIRMLQEGASCRFPEKVVIQILGNLKKHPDALGFRLITVENGRALVEVVPITFNIGEMKDD